MMYYCCKIHKKHATCFAAEFERVKHGWPRGILRIVAMGLTYRI